MKISNTRFSKISDAFEEFDFKRRELFRVDPNQLQLTWLRPCSIKMLVVLDGGSFGTADFGLEEFLSAFSTGGAPGVGFDVTTAHFFADSAADIENFEFAQHDLEQYDVIWLFGVLRPGSIPDDDLRALSEFMDGGGGVFATGDHENLGATMCGSVPRVRSMRKWHWPGPGPNGEPVAPAVGGVDRLDTVWDRGVGIVEFDDQSDDVPQQIQPRIYSSPHPFLPFASYRYPHPVLCGQDGVIDILPDHAHEGECYVPSDLTASFNFNGYDIEEYPVGAGGLRIEPEIIAWSNNQSGIVEKGAVNAKNFGAIGVLDGHQADVGRVLVDATWHHFFNINLRGEIGNTDPVQAAGFYNSASGLQALERIKNYYRNIAVWLARENTHRCIAWRSWWFIRWHHRVAMDLPKLGLKLDKIEPVELVRIGRIARDVYGKFASQCESLMWIMIFIPDDLRRELLWPVVPPGPLLPGFDKKQIDGLQNDPASQAIANTMLDAVVGSMVYKIANDFPENGAAQKGEKVDDPSEIFGEAAKIGLRAGAIASKEAMDNAEKMLDLVRRLAN